MNHSRHLNSPRYSEWTDSIRIIFDGKPGRPYLLMGAMLLMGAVLVYLISVLIAFSAMDQFGEEPFEIMAQMRTASLISAFVRAVAALLAIPGLIFAALGMIQFHHECQGRC